MFFFTNHTNLDPEFVFKGSVIKPASLKVKGDVLNPVVFSHSSFSAIFLQTRTAKKTQKWAI